METKEQRFSRVVEEYKRTIYTVCYMFSKDEDEVNDLFQEILIRLWQGFDSFEGKSDIKTWIYRVSLNFCLNYDKKQKRAGDRVKLDLDIKPYEDNYEKSLQVKRLYKRINALGLVDRSVILLWLEGLSYDEIGAILGISVKNVSIKLVRIKEQLKQMSNIKMSKTMEPVDINSIELQELKSEFNDMKETLNEQRIVNKGLMEHIQKQKASFIGNDLKTRLMMDLTAIPMILIICNAIGWPMLFAAAVSTWAIIDLIFVLWMRKRFNNQNLLESDVLTVARNVKEYKRFYHLSTVIGAIPAVAMTAYIVLRIYSQGASGNDMLWVGVLLFVTYFIAVLGTVRKYKKQMSSCDNLIESLERK